MLSSHFVVDGDLIKANSPLTDGEQEFLKIILNPAIPELKCSLQRKLIVTHLFPNPQETLVRTEERSRDNQ